MCGAGEVAEGYHTLKLLTGFLAQEGGEGLEEVPLLKAIGRTVLGGDNPVDAFDGLVMQAAGMQ